MILIKKKGFILIIVCSVMALLILTATVIVGFGCNELLTTRMRNDLLISAYYVAISGCELMYAHLKSVDTPDWGIPIAGTLSVGSNTIGTYNAVASSTGTNELCVVSSGTVNGHTATVTLKLGYSVSYQGPINIGSYGAMTLNGASNQAKIMMDGPAVSDSTVTVTGKVTISNGTIQNASLPKVSFFDTENPSALTVLKAADVNGDGIVTLQEAQNAGAVTEYNTVNAYTLSDPVTQLDAFYYYYTTYLNNPANNKLGQTLNIGVNQSRYYSTSQTFNTHSMPDSVPIIFVNGNATVTVNDGAKRNHTVVVTGNLTLHQPSNDRRDVNTYVVFGNVVTDGEMGHEGGTKGNLIIFANGNIAKTGGGKMNASFYANGILSIDTAADRGSDHLTLGKLTSTWTTSADKPLGLPLDYPTNVLSGFTIKNQSDYPPVWQRE